MIWLTKIILWTCPSLQGDPTHDQWNTLALILTTDIDTNCLSQIQTHDRWHLLQWSHAVSIHSQSSIGLLSKHQFRDTRQVDHSSFPTDIRNSEMFDFSNDIPLDGYVQIFRRKISINIYK